MAGRVFYIDPLHGSSANNGLTSADNAVGNTGPFGSLYDVLWGGDADPSVYGGSGDTYYLVASTGDVLTVSWDGGVTGAQSYAFYNKARWFDTAGYNSLHPPPKFIGVNTSLQEDGTLYDIQWNIAIGPPQTYGYAAFFTQRGIGEIWRNVKWTARKGQVNARVPIMNTYSSGGGGPYFVNCTWDWSNPDGLDNYGPTLWASGNPSIGFKACTFLGPSEKTNLCIIRGAQYGQVCHVSGCKFDSWLAAVEIMGTSEPIYGNIIKNCQYGIRFVTTQNGGIQPILNNLFYNIDNDAIYIRRTSDNSYTPRIMNNLFVDIGGYVFEAASGWGPASDYLWCIRKNVIQDATSGLLGPVADATHGGIYKGYTGDGLYGNVSDNAFITGLTLSIDSDFNVTISGFPSSALGLSGPYGDGSRSSAGAFLSSGVSGESSGGVEETEQARVTS